MPVIPTFENDVAAQPVQPVAANPAAFARSGQALFEGARALEAQDTAFTDRLVEAQLATNASTKLTALGKNLDDIQHKWSLVPDRAQALAGYEGEVQQLQQHEVDSIGNPLLRAHVLEQFGSEALARRDAVGKASFDLQASTNRGQLDKNLLDLSTQAAQAPNEHARAIITDNAMAAIEGAKKAGWIAPEEAAQHQIKWQSDTQAVRARSDMNNAINTQNPDAMYKLAQGLSDPANYPGMSQETRESLRTHVETLAYRLEMRAAQRQAHEDAMAERNFHRAQAHNEAVLLGGVLAGTHPLSDAQIEQLADRGAVSAGGVEALHTARDRAEDGHDDPSLAMHLWDAASRGEDVRPLVYAGQKQGQLAKSTAVDLIKTVDAKNQKGDSAIDRGNYNTLKTALNGGAIESGLFAGANRAQTQAQWAQAQGEWNRRVTLGGEDSAKVLTDMIPRYDSGVAKPTWLAPTKYGTPASTKDVMALAARLGAQVKAKQISQSDFQAQAELLTNYKRFYALEDQRTAARGKAKSKSVSGIETGDAAP